MGHSVHSVALRKRLASSGLTLWLSRSRSVGWEQASSVPGMLPWVLGDLGHAVVMYFKKTVFLWEVSCATWSEEPGNRACWVLDMEHGHEAHSTDTLPGHWAEESETGSVGRLSAIVAECGCWLLLRSRELWPAVGSASQHQVRTCVY